jgi:hypothetical protein
MSEKPPFNFEIYEPKREPEKSAESPEIMILRQKFSQELKKPESGSYYKKLQKIAAAFVLAGFATLVSPQPAIAPEKSKQLKSLKILESSPEKDIELYNKVLAGLERAVKEKGGIESSPQLSEEIFKPDILAGIARQVVGKEKEPYFSKPEIIFGEKFVKENPEKTKEYYKKILKTLKATVIVRSKGSLGSGVIIETTKGKIVLTNHHVVEEGNVFLEFFNGNKVAGEVMGTDSERDLAIVSMAIPEDKDEDLILKDTNSLHLNSSPIFKKGEDLALIGHPRGYPFEVSLAKFVNQELKKETILEPGGGQSGFKPVAIYSQPDERFAKLASYEIPPKWKEKLGPIAHKGDAIWGMSGGPIISLDKEGEPRLVGLNAWRTKAPPGSYFDLSEGISGNVIEEFLEEHDYSAK